MNKQYSIVPQVVRWAVAPFILGMVCMPAMSQLNVAAVNTAYAINFDGTVGGVESGVWAGGGFQPVPINGRLDSDAWAVTGWSNGDLAFGGTQNTAGTDYRRGIALAAVATGGMYAFDDGAGGVLAGRALGFQPGASDWAPGTITLRVQNNTGSTLTAFDLAYDVYYRDDQGRSSNFNLYVSDNNVSYTHISSQDVTSPVGPAGAAWVANARSVTVSGFYVPNGQYFYVRWRGADVAGAGSRDEFALDNISVTGRAYTLVRFTTSSSTVNESVGTTSLTASIVNPDPIIATTVDVALTSGNAARINSYTTQTITFPGGSVANQNLTITVSDNGACDGDEVEVFTMQNIGGGITPSIGTPGTYTLTIDDDETAPEEFAQFFDGGVGDNWSITAGGANQSSATGAGDTPANQRVLSTTQSWQVSNAAATLDLATVSTVDWSGITISARVSSTGSSGSNGNEASDSIAFYVDVDGAGFPVDPDIRIAGNSNARWGYSTGTGVAGTAAGSPMNFQPGAGGDRTTDGYSFVSITVPNGTSTVALRVVATNNATTERWNLDNVEITGTLCSPVYYSRSNGSEATATWSTARTGLPAPGLVTFNENATMVVQNTHTVTTTNNATITLRNLNVETGGSLSLTGNCDVEINGPTLDVDGSLSSTDDDFYLLSDELTSISGSAGTIEVDDMTLDGFGVIVTVNTLKIRGTLQLDNGDFDGNLKEVQLISNASGTARLGPVAATASYTSRLRIERFIPAGATDWRLLCSPMQNKTVSDWTDDFYTAGFPGSYYPNFYVNNVLWPSVRMYDETNPGLLDSDGLIGVSNVSEPLTVGKGFAAWSGTTLNTTTAFTIDVRGLPTVASTPFTIPMSYTNSPATAAVDGLNLVGNPLPSPIDFGALSLGADVDSSYYIYDPGAGVNVGWDEVAQVGTGGCNGNIQSSQGFWLHCTGAANSVTVDESAKVLEPINGGVFSDVQDERAMVRLFLSGQNSAFIDEALVHFISGSPAFGTSDMVKLSFGNDSAMRITTKAVTGEDLMINAFGALSSSTDIPVKVIVPQSGDYTIRLGDVSVLRGIACATLEDLLTGSVVAVEEDATMTFSLDAAAPTEPARFVLHFSEAVSSSVVDATCAGSNDGELLVHGPGAGPWDYSLEPVGGGAMMTLDQVVGPAAFNGLNEGDYVLTVEGSTGCGALVQAIHIESPGVLDGEAVSSPASCIDATNGSVGLTVMGGTAPYSFAWSNGSTDEDLSNVAPGAYTVVITDANGCTADPSAVQVGVGPGPIAAFTTFPDQPNVDEDLFFFNTGTYHLDYLWNFGDGETSTESEPVHQYDEGGVYTVTLTTTDGDCAAVLSQDILVLGSTGLSTSVATGSSAWVEGSTIVVQWDLSAPAGITAELVDATGRTIDRRSATGGSGRIIIPGSGLPDGIYFVRVDAGKHERTFKLSLAR